MKCRKVLYILVDGIPYQAEEARLSIKDRGFLYGQGVFTTTRIQDGAIFNWNSHRERLYAQCLKLGIERPFLSTEAYETLIALNEAQQGVWKFKVIVTAGVDDGKLALEGHRKATVVMTLEPLQELKKSGWQLTLEQVSRSFLLAQCKTLAYLENIWFLGLAHKRQADEVLLTDERGYLLETATAAIFWIVGDTLFYPSFKLPLLPSTTVQWLLDRADNLGLKTEESVQRLADIPQEAVWYAANALRGVIPIISIDGQEKVCDAGRTCQLQKCLCV